MPYPRQAVFRDFLRSLLDQPTHAARSWARTYGLALLLTLGVGNPAQGKELSPSDNRLAAVVAGLKHAPAIDRQAFVRTALEELIDQYQAVLDQAWQRRASTSAEQRKLSRWRSATGGFVAQLENTLLLLESGAPLSLNATPTGQVILYVNGQPTVLEGPDVASSGPLADRILARYCDEYECAGRTSAHANDPTMDSPSPDHDWQARLPGGYWEYQNDQGPRFVMDDGLVFSFSVMEDRTTYQQYCEDLANELRQLAEALEGSLRAGHLVDWPYLEVSPAPDGMGTRVMINQQQEFLRLRLPLLSQLILLPPEMMTWLHARVRGNNIEVVIPQAESLFPGDQRRLGGLGGQSTPG